MKGWYGTQPHGSFTLLQHGHQDVDLIVALLHLKTISMKGKSNSTVSGDL